MRLVTPARLLDRGHPGLAPVALAGGAAHAHGDRDRAERMAQMYDAGMIGAVRRLAQRPRSRPTRPGQRRDLGLLPADRAATS